MNNTKENLYLPYSKGFLKEKAFQYIIKQNEIKPSYIFASWDRSHLYKNHFKFDFCCDSLASSSPTFEKDWYYAQTPSADPIYPLFFFPFIVFSFLVNVQDLIKDNVVEKLIKEAEDFDPSFSPIFFLQLAYRLSYAILGHNYEEERGKLFIEEIKQRCIIEDYWSTFIDVYPTSLMERKNSYYPNIIVINKGKKFILPYKNGFGSIYDLRMEEKDCLKRKKQYFTFLSKTKNSNDILYTYIEDLPANKENPYYLCAYEDSLEITDFSKGYQIEDRFGLTKVPKIPTMLYDLYEKSLKEGIVDMFSQEKVIAIKKNRISMKISKLYDFLTNECSFFFSILKEVAQLKEEEKALSYLNQLFADIEYQLNYDLETNALILYNIVSVLYELMRAELLLSIYRYLEYDYKDFLRNECKFIPLLKGNLYKDADMRLIGYKTSQVIITFFEEKKELYDNFLKERFEERSLEQYERFKKEKFYVNTIFHRDV